MSDADERADCGRAKATGMRISRSRRCSFIRAIARRSWRSTISCAPPTTSPTTRRLPPQEKLALLDRLEAGLSRRERRGRGRGAIANGACRARAVAEARAGSARRVQARRHQAALSRLGRSDQLLLAVGDAGRPLRAATCMARAAPSGRPTMRCAPPCRSSIICRTARTIICNLDRVYVPLDALAASGSDGRSARRAARIAGAARLPAQACRANRTAAERERWLSRMIDDWRLGLEVSVINTLAHRLTRLLMRARSAAANRASFGARGRRLDARSASCTARRGGSAGVSSPPRRSRGVRK